MGGPLWRVVYKTLKLLDHIVRNGSEQAIEDACAHMRELKALRHFEFVDPEGRDMGINVREKAKEVIEAVADPPSLGLLMCVMRPKRDGELHELPFLLPAPRPRCSGMKSAARVLASRDLIRPTGRSDALV